MNSDEFMKLREELKEMKKAYLTAGQDLFRKEAQALFDNNQDLKSFAWAQYTTYFNDGDTCYFGVKGHSPWVNGCRYEYSEDEEILEAGLTIKRFDELTLQVSKLLDNYDTEENEMKTWFGDHTKIVVTKDQIEVQDYSDHS